MENAFSLLRQVKVFADSADYRQNLDDQLVCPECFEQVFKKEMWVPSKFATTHFFSHYAGQFDGCSLRTLNENTEGNKSDSQARLQRLSEFNQRFRSEILKGFSKVVGKSTASHLTETLEFAERIASEKLKSGEIVRLSQKLIKTLSDPITSSVDESLDDLEEALCPLYWHLTTPYGKNNLYFVTVITLLIAYHEETPHIEELLDKKFLKRTTNIDGLLLGNSVLLLAHYINWKGSLKSIYSFLGNLDTSVKPVKVLAPSRYVLNAKLKRSNSKQEHIQYCSVCKNPFISKGDKNCSFCAWSARSIQPTESTHYFEKKSWLSSQPWDEKNLQQHKSNSASKEIPAKLNQSNNSIKQLAIESNSKKTMWTKTERGLRNKETGEIISFVDTLRSVFPVAGYSVNRGFTVFIADSDIEK